jgi:hypothetical protein
MKSIEEIEQSYLQITNAIHKAANKAPSKAQKKRREEWWKHEYYH